MKHDITKSKLRAYLQLMAQVHRSGTQTIGAVSTAHITEKDATLIDNEPRGDDKYCHAVGRTGYGWIVRTGIVHDKALNPEFSKAYRTLLKFFNQNGVYYLNIDRDGDIIKGFETFDW